MCKLYRKAKLKRPIGGCGDTHNVLEHQICMSSRYGIGKRPQHVRHHVHRVEYRGSTANITFTKDITCVAFLIWSIWDERKNPSADMAPQIKRIVATSRGMLKTDPKYTTSVASTKSAGSPNSSSDRASPTI